MSAEGKPPAESSVLARPMAWILRGVLACPWLVVTAAVALAIVSGLYALQNLGYRTSRLDLLNPKSEPNRLWIEHLKEFGAEDDAVVVVEGTSEAQVAPVLRDLGVAIARQPKLFSAVLHELDLAKLRSKGLHYLGVGDLQNIERFLDEATPIIEGRWTDLKVGPMTTALAMRVRGAAIQAPQLVDRVAEQLDRYTTSLLANLGPSPRYVSPWPGMPQPPAEFAQLQLDANHLPLVASKDGQFGFILLRLDPGSDNFAKGTEATDALRAIIATVQQQHPECKIGLTGLPIMENDEMRSSKSSMIGAEIVSQIGVILLMIAAFGGFRHSLVANLVLMLSIVWTFGFATLVVGHLNILSVAFTVTLNGLGIDYGLYFLARYVRIRKLGFEARESLIASITEVGPAIAVGALTTSAGFLAAVLTSFTGVAELGVIAGGGVILCMIGQLFVLPAVVLLMDAHRAAESTPQLLHVDHWVRPLFRRPRPLVMMTLAATLVLAVGLSKNRYDHNLLNMQPKGLESVDLERRLLVESKRSMWHATSTSDSREELLARKAAMEKLDSVERTEEIVSLMPSDEATKQPIIERINRRLAALPQQPPMIAVDSMQELSYTLAQSQGALAGIQQAAGISAGMEQLRELLRTRPVAECYELLSRFQQTAAVDLLTRLHALREVANPASPQIADLPESLAQRYVGATGKHLLKVYGRGDIWDMAGLQKFVQDVRSVDPRATGNPLQAYEASLEIKKSYEQAALYTLIVVAVVLLLDFRSVRWTLLSMASTGVGLAQMFGLMGLLDIPLNAANLIALPILLGVGIDYGLHVVHDFRAQSGRYSISNSTAVSVLVDGLTTVVGFGAFMIADHQGLQSLGRVLTLGATCCMFSALVMLPAILTWITWGRQTESHQGESENAEDTAAEPPSVGGEGALLARHRAAHSVAAPTSDSPSAKTLVVEPAKSQPLIVPRPRWTDRPAATERETMIHRDAA